MYDKVTLEKRLQDTQLKLKRMVNDGEERDRHMDQLQTKLTDLQSLFETLKDHVDKGKLESILEEHEKKKQSRESEKITTQNSDETSEEIIRKQELKSQHKESKVCIIQ